jgi:hypothetical protein
MSAVPERPGQSASRAAGFDPARFFRWAALATAVLVLAQAVLAGRGWFVDIDLIEVHGWVGNATFLAAITQVALAYVGWSRGAVGRLELGLSALLVVLLVAQLGLGYSGRESAGAAAWHVPNGVLIFGLSAAILARSLPRQRTPAA